ncbi:chlorophyllase, partial [Streptomyces sp. PGLac3x]
MDSAPVSVPVPVPVVSVKPLVLAVPGRGEELRVRVSAPVTGRGLPVVV